LILDEPTTGLDPLARQEVLSAMTDVLRDDERTILFSSHNTTDVEQLSDTITFINDGQIIASQNKESFLDSWRRIRVRLPGNGNLPAMEGIKQVQTSGRLAVVTTDRFTDTFSDQINHHFQNTGITINAVEHMTLEEIFIVEAASNQKSEARI
jgi:ABC-2 type transport system ATP-binding protein